MNPRRTPRQDLAHHHPHVHRATFRGWSWDCSCGGASARSPLGTHTWHEAVIGALNHSGAIAA